MVATLFTAAVGLQHTDCYDCQILQQDPKDFEPHFMIKEGLILLYAALLDLQGRQFLYIAADQAIDSH